MRQWQAQGAGGRAADALGGLVRALGQEDFPLRVLEELQPLVPAASWSVYRTGPQCRPVLFMSASRGVPDRTRDCWWAYLSGPYREDRSFGEVDRTPRLCHVMAGEIPGEHRARVYDAHGLHERISVVEHDGQAVFAVNLYRHEHQRPFTDAQIAAFEAVALPLLELARKHIAIAGTDRMAVARPAPSRGPVAPRLDAVALRERLLALDASLTPRELDVCLRIAQGMTYDGIAADLGLGVTTVKTYRDRAFARLGIHFRNELFARVFAG